MVCWSPVKNQFVYIEQGNRIRLYDDDTKAIITLFDDPETKAIHFLEWSADEKSIASSMEYGQHEGIYLLNIDKAEITKLSGEEVYYFEWYTD